jgi:hypothetical protein
VVPWGEESELVGVYSYYFNHRDTRDLLAFSLRGSAQRLRILSILFQFFAVFGQNRCMIEDLKWKPS